ncbi:MAG TPA: PAS domain S-box protein [Longimicrobium sp.]|nr:PAS domain S-box protein [Longimicrobium sp.]
MMGMATEVLRVLLVEDDEDDYVLTRGLLRDARGVRFEVEWQGTAAGGLAAVRGGGFDAVLLDQQLGAASGLDLLGRLTADADTPPVLLLTGQGDPALDEAAMRAGAADFLVKRGLTPLLLERSIRYAVQQSRSERALRESEERFRQLAENIGAVFWLHDLHSARTIYVSPAFERIWGRPVEEMYGDPAVWLDSIHPDDRPLADPARFSEQPYEQEYRILRPDGSERWIRDRGFPIRDGQGRVYRTAGIAEDVTERKQAQAALVQREAHFRSLIENAHDLIMIVDERCVMRYHSPSLERLLGYPHAELAGRDGFELVHPEDLPGVLEVFGDLLTRPGGAVRHEYRVSTSDGGWKLLDTRGTNLLHDPAVGGIVLNSHDVTDRRQAEEGLRLSEEQLRQSQKMEAVGRLAGGVAHDFNNLLTAIQGNVEMLMLEVPHAGAIRDDLMEIKRAATRAASLTRQLLAFSRKQMIAPKVLDVNAVVHELERMLVRVIGEDVQLETSLGAEHATVRADPGQLEQVVLNLAVNARDAMPRGGTLRIQTREVMLGEAEAQRYPYQVDPGEYVRLSVSDTGVGMSPEVLARVFEPFFTTKEPGKGTGLGLSTVYGIVKQSGGYVWADSEEGRGSTFRVYLPRVNAEPDRVEPQPQPEAAKRAEGVVLLVEDEEGVRSLSRRILERRGYTVLAARNGAQAREMFAGNGSHVDLLLTDVVMPHESGRELAEALLLLQPGLRVVFMSGYTDDALIRHGVLEDRFRLLEKPFAPEGLVRMVREALEA